MRDSDSLTSSHSKKCANGMSLFYQYHNYTENSGPAVAHDFQLKLITQNVKNYKTAH